MLFEMNWGVVIGIVVLCLLAEGFFAGSELALVACNKLRMQQRADAGSKKAKAVLELLNNPAQLFSTTLFGTNLATISASTVTTLFLIDEYGSGYGSLAILLAPLILLFAEILPKSIYQHNADWIVERIASPLLFFRVLFYPAVWPLSRLTGRLLGVVQKVMGQQKIITRNELAALLEGEEAARGDILPSERSMISRILRLPTLTAHNIMLPLTGMETLPVSASREVAIDLFDLKGIPFVPIFNGRVFDIVGVLEMSDVLCSLPGSKIDELMRTPIYVPESAPLHELYRVLRQYKEGIVVVVDEYGGAVGLISIEEIFEEVVGDIKDEFDLDEQLYTVLGPRHFSIMGRMEIEDVISATGIDLPEGDYETIGGMLLAHFHHIPKVGEEVTINQWNYRVSQATERTLVEVEVKYVGSDKSDNSK